MHPLPDHSACELGRSVLMLRRDLVFTPQSFAGKDYIVIEDPLNSKFHRVGVREYAFLSLLDGRTTLAEALRLAASAAPREALEEHEAAALSKWLVDAELASTAESSLPGRLSSAADRSRRGWWAANWNPLSLRIPLVDPQRLLTVVAPWVTWLFSGKMFVAWLGLVALAAYQVWCEAPRLGTSLADIFVPGNWLWLGGAWLALKVLHETAHGIVCKKYGGTVRVAGVMLVLLAPIAYVDVTSAWRLRSKWQRVHVAAAGMYVEILIAAVAALVWARTGPGVLNHLCLNVAVMASATTVLFNVNPLMRFDGYYMLTDALELPNLYTVSQQWFSGFASRLLLGHPAPAIAFPRGWGHFVRGYALAAFAWRIVTCVGLLVAAVTMFHGAGLVLAACGIVAWVALPAWKFLQRAWQGKTGQRTSWRRLGAVWGALATVIGLLFLVVPWPGASCAPAVVEYAPLSLVRVSTPGFVREVRVASGDLVEQDQVLAILENKDLMNELADLRLALEQSLLQSRANVTRQKLAESQAELEKVAALKKQIVEKEARVEQLTIRAAQGGQIAGRELEALLGTHRREGDVLFALGDESRKELQISVVQDDLDAFAEQVGKPVDIRVPGVGLLSATLTRLQPRASLTLKHAQLAAPCGGPVPVRTVSPEQHDSEFSPSDTDKYELLTPHLQATVDLTSAQSRGLHSGQLAYVSFLPCRETVGMHLYNSISRWLRIRLNSSNS